MENNVLQSRRSFPTKDCDTSVIERPLDVDRIHPETDLTIVCGSRPDLLSRTLASFSQELLSNFRFARAYANIDLFGGDEHDRAECEAILQSYLPAVKIFKPANPSFGAAVKLLWSRTSAPFICHLEDDWIALEPITPNMIFPHFNHMVKVATLTSREHKLEKHIKRHGDYYLRAVKRKAFFGVALWSSSHNDHGVSPCFLDGDFARQWARMLNPALDPEKQIRADINKPLFDFATRYKRRMVTGSNRLEIIEDIGRAWHIERGVKKSVLLGKSIWTDSDGVDLVCKRTRRVR